MNNTSTKKPISSSSSELTYKERWARIPGRWKFILAVQATFGLTAIWYLKQAQGDHRKVQQEQFQFRIKELEKRKKQLEKRQEWES